MQALANLFGKLREYFFGVEYPNGLADIGKVIGLDVCDRVLTRFRLALQALGDAFQKLRPMEKQRGRVAFQRIVNQFRGFLRFDYRGIDPDLDVLPVFEVGNTERELQWLRVAAADGRLRVKQFVFLPLAFRGRNDRAFHRGMAFLAEVVHQRKPDDFFLFFNREHPEPGMVSAGNDPFLHVGDRRARVLHVVVQLLAVFGR